jgi:hypothetical protein
MKDAFSKLKSKISSAPSIANKAIEQVSGELGTTLDSETSQTLKKQTIDVVRVAISVAKNIGDLNGDGKVDKEDIKFAAKKAGFVWDKLDSDLKESLLLGGVAGVAVNAIPLVGQFAAVPTFAMATAGFFVRAKISAISVKKIIKEEGKKNSSE